MTWSEYDDDGHWLKGYAATAYDEGNEAAVLVEMLNADEEKWEKVKEDLNKIVFREMLASDFVLCQENFAEDYDEQMNSLYEKYKAIIKNPTTYLQSNYDAPGEDYHVHYIADLLTEYQK